MPVAIVIYLLGILWLVYPWCFTDVLPMATFTINKTCNILCSAFTTTAVRWLATPLARSRAGLRSLLRSLSLRDLVWWDLVNSLLKMVLCDKRFCFQAILEILGLGNCLSKSKSGKGFPRNYITSKTFVSITETNNKNVTLNPVLCLCIFWKLSLTAVCQS